MSDTGGAAYDLAVIGGGFAGLAAARAAALRGLRVTVLEAKPVLGARLHTTGIFVREAADACDIPMRLAHRVTRVRLYGPSRTSIDLDGPGYYFLTTDTAEVLRWLGEEARRAGAEIGGHAEVADRQTLDAHLADQLLPLLALAREPSSFTCEAISPHLRTVAWLLGQLVPATIDLDDGPPARVRVVPRGRSGS